MQQLCSFLESKQQLNLTLLCKGQKSITRIPHFFLSKGEKSRIWKTHSFLFFFFSRPGILPGISGNIHFLFFKPIQYHQGEKETLLLPACIVSGSYSAVSTIPAGERSTGVPRVALPQTSAEQAVSSFHSADQREWSPSACLRIWRLFPRV